MFNAPYFIFKKSSTISIRTSDISRYIFEIKHHDAEFRLPADFSKEKQALRSSLLHQLDKPSSRPAEQSCLKKQWTGLQMIDFTILCATAIHLGAKSLMTICVSAHALFKLCTLLGVFINKVTFENMKHTYTADVISGFDVYDTELTSQNILKSANRAVTIAGETYFTQTGIKKIAKLYIKKNIIEHLIQALTTLKTTLQKQPSTQEIITFMQQIDREILLFKTHQMYTQQSIDLSLNFAQEQYHCQTALQAAKEANEKYKTLIDQQKQCIQSQEEEIDSLRIEQSMPSTPESNHSFLWSFSRH